MEHSFDIEIAKEYGILEAIILKHFYFWIEKNRANNQNYYDGYYWTYNSVKAFKELFQYATERKIQNALKNLINENIIITGNYNKSAYDRTLWYAITKKGYSIMQKCKMEDTEKGNGNVKNVEPIPDNNTDNNTDVKHIYISDDEEKPLKNKKHKHGEYNNVLLTDDELDKLKNIYGEEDTHDAIQYLDEYIEMKGAKYKNHYLALRKWVFDAIRKGHNNGRNKQGTIKPTRGFEEYPDER